MTIRYKSISGYHEVVLINRITHLTKTLPIDKAFKMIGIEDEEDLTFIHLDTGDILVSTDSMNTIEARIQHFSKE